MKTKEKQQPAVASPTSPDTNNKTTGTATASTLVAFNKTSASTTMKIDDIDLRKAIQTRVEINSSVVEGYCQLMLDGVKFPPITGIRDELGILRLVDGRHRLDAAIKAGLTKIEINIRQGERLDAVKRALRANSTHGLARTNADKRKAVEMALREFSKVSYREVARLCGVGNQLVGVVVNEMRAQGQLCDSHTSKGIGKDGKNYSRTKRKGKVTDGNTGDHTTTPTPTSTSPAATKTQPTTDHGSSPDSAPDVSEVTSHSSSGNRGQASEDPHPEAGVELPKFTDTAGKGRFDMIAVDFTNFPASEIELCQLNPRAKENCVVAVKVQVANIPLAIGSADGKFSFGCVVSLLAEPLTEESGPRPVEYVVVLLKGHSKVAFEPTAVLIENKPWAEVLRGHYCRALGHEKIKDALFLSGEEFRSQILKAN